MKIHGYKQLSAIWLIVSLSILSFGCAQKAQPVYFPALPAPPRIQHLLTFNNESSLETNLWMQAIIGEKTGETFSRAYGLEFYQGKLFVADAGKSSVGVAVVDFTERKIKLIDGIANKPFSIAIDDD